MTLRFEIRNAAGRQPFLWRIVDGGDILARSETMFHKQDAVSAAENMKYHTDEHDFEIITTRLLQYPYSWHAQAENGRIVVSSITMYPTYEEADTAKEHVRQNAPDAEIVDLT